MLGNTKQYFSQLKLHDEFIPSYLIIAAVVLTVLAYPLYIISHDFKVLYIISNTISVIGLVLKLLRNEIKFIVHPVLLIVLLMVLVGISMFQIETLNLTAFHQYLGYLSRVFPFIVFFYVYSSFCLNIEFFAKMAVIICSLGLCVLIYSYHGVSEINTENSIGGMLVSLMPLLLLEKKYLMLALTAIFIIFSEGRMVQLSLVVIMIAWVAGHYCSKRMLFILVTMMLVGVPISLMIIKVDIFFPEKYLYFPGAEWVRISMNYASNYAIANNFWGGVGFGEICNITYRNVGRCIIPHGAHSFFWAQSGVLAYAIFLGLSITSIYRPLLLFYKFDDKYCLAISLVNLAGFLIYLTRPHYDSSVYHLYWMLGISMTCSCLSNKESNKRISIQKIV